jgi:streptogramin lyase
MSTDGTFTEHPLNNGPAYSLTPTPDGNVWFTQNTNKLGIMDSEGAISYYTVQTYSSDSYGNLVEQVANGVDGSVWFAEADVDSGGHVTSQAIGYRAADGNITYYPVPLADSQSDGVYSLNSDSDGNAWFSYENNVSEISPNGSTTTYSLSDSLPDDSGAYMSISKIVSNSDGAWFVKYVVDNGNISNEVGHIATSGTITEYPLTTDGQEELNDIVAMPDGDMLAATRPEAAPAQFFQLTKQALLPRSMNP